MRDKMQRRMDNARNAEAKADKDRHIIIKEINECTEKENRYRSCINASRVDDDWRCSECHILYSEAGDDAFDGKKWKACGYDEKGCSITWCPDCTNGLAISHHETTCRWKHAAADSSKVFSSTPDALQKKRKASLTKKADGYSNTIKRLKCDLDKITFDRPPMTESDAIEKTNHPVRSISELVKKPNFKKESCRLLQLDEDTC